MKQVKRPEAGTPGLNCRHPVMTEAHKQQFHSSTTSVFLQGRLMGGRMKTLLLKTIQCKWCSRSFDVCRSCWRGQIYCCDECREAAQMASHRKAQQQYRLTAKGKTAHRQAERRRRLRQHKKTMDDASSTPHPTYDTPSKKLTYPVGCCHFCGRRGLVMDHFPRRGYGKTNFQGTLAGLQGHGGWNDSKRTPYSSSCQET